MVLSEDKRNSQYRHMLSEIVGFYDIVLEVIFYLQILNF